MIDFVAGARGTVDGRLAEVRWRDERSGRLIGTLELADGRRLPIVGILADAAEGERLTLEGTIAVDPRFGMQFQIEQALDPNASAEIAQAYLASGLVAHVGPATAEAIVAAFGADTLRVLAEQPERLTAFRGITAARLPAVRRSLRETIQLAPVVGLLDPYGVSTSVCRRIMRRHGRNAVEVVRANPWRLAGEIFGVGFLTADRVALGIGRPADAPERLEAAVLHVLREAGSQEGHIVLGEGIIATRVALLTGQPADAAREAIARLVANEELVACDRPPGYALPRLAAAEALVASKVRSFASWSDPEPIVIDDAEMAALERAEGISFDPSQRAAVRDALASRVTVITGPPGTGKTTIVRAVLDAAQARGLSMALVSFTGKAAKRLAQATGRPAQTIHRFLRYHPDEGFRGPEQLPELLVVDETSMLDSALAARLLAAQPPFTRLLLVGDVDQLPAIGPGNVLADLIASPAVQVFRLSVIHRTAAGSGVPMLANQIRLGIKPRFRIDPADGKLRELTRADADPYFDGRTTRFVPRDTPEDIAAYIIAKIEASPERVPDIQVLCPMNKGAAGTHALNRALQAALNPAAPGKPSVRGAGGVELRVGDRVYCGDNLPAHDLYNGEVGYLRDIAQDGTLLLEMDGDERRLPTDMADSLSLAYAMSVHKAQGSEFPIVMIPLHPSAYMLLRRRLLYTAVSRARQTVVVVGTPKALGIAIGRDEDVSRQTLLRGYLAAGSSAPPAPIALPDDELF